MLASSFFDPVLGIDIHWEMVPTPAPVPTPIPNPFTGMIFDPAGLAIGLALGAAMSLVCGAPVLGPVLYWSAVPATNTGTKAIHIPGHILIPPGTAWAPFPKTPAPVIKPGAVLSPPKPAMPDNDAFMIFGSKTVTVMGSNACRLGDIALSCSEPLRLPSSVVLAIPKGRPILIGGSPSLDLMSAVLGSLRTRFASDSLHALISRLSPGRFRNLLSRAVCFFTGHPVDVASGRVMTSDVDAELPGPLPLKIERIYSSAWAGRDGPLGPGWSWSLDQAVWRERGKLVQLAEDGREIEYDTFDLPGRRLAPGQELFHPIERLTISCGHGEVFRIVDAQGTVREYAPVPGRVDGRSMLRSIRSRCRNHTIELHYDARGRLAAIRDCGGRPLAVRWNAAGRVDALELPAVHGDGTELHRRYEYDAAGDLCEIHDSREHTWRFEYVGHLLVRETDRSGLSFYFLYDGLGPDAWCIRTWGDGGIFDRTLSYDKAKKVTVVTDASGHTQLFRMNAVGLVVECVDAIGGSTRYEYDPSTLRRITATDPMGSSVRTRYDARGNLVRAELANGDAIELEYGVFELPVAGTDLAGRPWRWIHDLAGLPIARRAPDGTVTRTGWDAGLPAWEDDALGNRRVFVHDAAKNLVRVVLPDGAALQHSYDRRGRPTAMIDARGGLTRLAYDGEDNVVRLQLPNGHTQRMVYDAEDNLVRCESPERSVEYGHAGLHRVAVRHEGDAAIALQWDLDGRLVGTLDAAGNHRRFELDAMGNVVAEFDAEGVARRVTRDVAGRPVRIELPSGRASKLSYDVLGRIARVEHADGTFVAFERRSDGVLLAATNEHGRLELERDACGRLIAERWNGHVVESTWAGEARVAMRTDLGAAQIIERDRVGSVVAMIHGRTIRARTQLRRDADGREIERRLPGQVFVQSAWDAAGRPTWRRIGAFDSEGLPRELELRRVVWADEDRITAIEDSRDGRRTYLHDARKRLVREVGPDAEIVRALDLVGNVYEHADRHDRSYAPTGRIERRGGTRYQHDADGNLVAKIASDGATWRYAWNGHGQLAEVERPDGRRIRFTYDPLGRRTGKTILVGSGDDERVEDQVAFVWDEDVVVHEVRSDATITWYWDPDSFAPVAREQGGALVSLVVDHLGVPTTAFDGEGRQIWRMRLDVFGLGHVTGDDALCPWRWPGQYADRETGLHYNRFRYYDPEAQRYVSCDPIGVLGGFHPYAYVDDPLVGLDPWGLVNPRDLGDHQLFEHIMDVLYRDKRALGTGGRHGLVHRIREQITGAMRPGNPGWATHEGEILAAQQNLRDALREWRRRGLPETTRDGDALFKDAWRLATQEPPAGNQRHVPPRCGA